MATHAQASCTLSTITDVEAVYTYYYLSSSSITVNEAPKDGVNPPGADNITIISDDNSYTWTRTEPSLNIENNTIQTAVGQLYVIECVLFSDNTYDWGPLMTSSTYAAAKAAYNLSSQALAQAAAANEATALLGGHFIYNSDWATTKTPHSANVVENIGTDGVYEQTPSQWEHNVHIGANGIKLRYNEINLSEWTTSGLIFYHPSSSSQGTKGVELNSSALKFYDATGTTAQATFGGTQATISGTINVYDGKIGSGSNYWYIGNYTDYNQHTSAIIKSIGTASIQLNETDTWRIATNRIHTAWAPSSGTDAYKLHFPVFNDSSSNEKYWDYGLHLPESYNDKFLYIRNAPSDQTLDNLLNDIDDGGYNYWTYKFYIDGEGNVHAPGFYVGDSTTPIGGGANTIAQKIINSDGTTYGKGSSSNPIYIDSSGYVQASDSAIGSTSKPIYMNNGTLTALSATVGGATTPVYLNSGTITALSYTIAKSVPSNAVFTDINVQTSQANTTKIYLTGTSTAGTSTGTLKFDSNVYINNTAGALYATTFNGYTLAAASAKGVVTSVDTSANLPTSNAVKTFVEGKGYLTSVTLTQDSTDEHSFSITESGGEAQTITIPDNNTTYTFAGGTNKFTVTPSGGTAQTVTVTPSITNNITGSGTSGYLAKFTGGNTIGNGPALGTDTTKFLNNKGEWAIPAGTYTYTLPLAADGTRGGVQIGYTQSGKNYPVQLSSEKMYVNVPWTDTTYESKTATSGGTDVSLVTTGEKYTWNSKTSNTGTVTSVKVQGSNGLTGSGTITTSGTITISHADTSSQDSITENDRTYIKSVTLDGYGHVTGLTTGTETVTNTHYTTHLYAGTSSGKVNAATTNGNTYLMVLDNTTVRDRRKISGSGSTSVSSDSSGNIDINTPISLTGVGFANGTITFTKSDGNTIPITTNNFVITQATGATSLVRLQSDSTTEYEGYSAGGATTAPVYFDSEGHPVAVTSIPYTLLSGAPTSLTPSSHTHGNITNGGDITATAPTIANGDQIVINDHSASKITNGPTFDGSTTTQALTKAGTWATFNNYSHPTYTTATAAAVKVGRDSTGHVVIGDALTYSDVGAAAASHGTHVTYGTSTQAIGTAAAGTAATVSRSDHVHSISLATGDNNGQVKIAGSNISVKGWTSWLPLAGGTMTGNIKRYNSAANTEPMITLLANNQDAYLFEVGHGTAAAATTSSNHYKLLYKGTGSSPNNYLQLIASTGSTDTVAIQIDENGNVSFTNTISGNLSGNASTATSAGKWTTARNFTIKDSDSTNSGTAASVDGSAAVTLLLPSTIKASLTGNASTATKWASAQKVYVTLGTASTTTTIQGGSTSAQTIGVNGTLAVGNGGTGKTSWTQYGVLYASASATLANTAAGAANTALMGKGSAAPAFVSVSPSISITAGTSSTAPKINLTVLGVSGTAQTITTASTSVYGVTKLTDTYTSTNSTLAVTGKAVASAISGASNTYVTIATDQTITATQKTFNGAIRWGTSDKYGACSYNSDLDALVFSFI